MSGNLASQRIGERRPWGGSTRFTEATDGTSIAYSLEGDGPPLVHLPTFLWLSHLRAERAVRQIDGWLDELATYRTVCRYDGRGTGLSEREVDDLSLAAHLSDLEAVVEAVLRSTVGPSAGLSGRRVDLLAMLHAVPVCLAYAARRPERVSRVVLWCGYARGADYFAAGDPAESALELGDDWPLLARVIARRGVGWGATEAAPDGLTELIRDCADREILSRLFGEARRFNASRVLTGVEAPTLVLQRLRVGNPGIEEARRLSASIPGSQLTIVEGRSLVPYVDNQGPILRLIGDFLEPERTLASEQGGDAGSTGLDGVGPDSGLDWAARWKLIRQWLAFR